MISSADPVQAIELDRRVSRHPRVPVLGSWIDPVDMDGALAICENAIRTRRPVQHVVINVAKLMSMRSDPQLRGVIEGCELVTADSRPVVWASRIVGHPLPCNVSGFVLMHELLDVAERKGYRVYVLGAKPHVLEKAIQRLHERYPQLTIAGYRHGYFDRSEDRNVAEEIATTNPDILFVAISSPRKEQFLGEHRDALNTPFMMGVGGSIDIVAGVTRQAPAWMNWLGMEWLFRLLQEPRRLFRRYAVTNTMFFLILVRAVLARHLSRLRFRARSASPWS